MANPKTLEISTVEVETIPDGVHHRRGPRYWKTRLTDGANSLVLKDAGWEVVARGLRSMGYLPLRAGGHPDLDVNGLTDEHGGYLGRREYDYEDAVYPGAFPPFVTAVEHRVRSLFGAGCLDIASIPGPPAPLVRWEDRRRLHISAARPLAMVTGMAIGDSLANQSACEKPAARRQRVGEVRSYLPMPRPDGSPTRLPGTSTNLAVRVLEANLDKGFLDLRTLTEALLSGALPDAGRTIRAWAEAARGARDPWDARQHSAGSGALMRVVGLFAPHSWTSGQTGLQRRHVYPTWYWDVILGSALTHDDQSSTAACVGFAAVLNLLLNHGALPSAESIVEAYVSAARPLEGESRLTFRVPSRAGAHSSTWQLVADEVLAAIKETPLEASTRWHSGSFVLETVPTAMHLITRYRHDPVECIVRAVNDTDDNAGIAALCGAAMGALHGTDAFLPEWRTELLGRTRADDDGHLTAALRRLREYGGWDRDDGPAPRGVS